MIEDDLIRAIQEGKLVEFEYSGLLRIFEPTTFGSLKGNKSVIGTQIDGETSTGYLPAPRRFSLNKIRNFNIIEENRPSKASWDEIYASKEEN